MKNLPKEYKDIYDQFSKKIDPSRIYTEPLETFAFGTDASFYRLIPKIVVKADNAEEVSYILSECNRASIPVTFRAAGTSLSGQAITDSVLVVAGNAWKKHKVLDNGDKIRLQPGVIGAHANNILRPYLRKIGPDPASINSAMVGGIAANNASGMCCGTAQNSYQTVDSMKVIIKDGTLLDTGDADSRKEFEKSHSNLLEELKQLSQDVKNNKALSERITHKFKMKNTTGYSLNALVDFDDPFDILEHIMIGSEGTLGFIAEITYRTVEEHQHKASALITFPSIEDACRAVIRLKSEPVQAVELMDRVSLRSMENADGVPAYLKDLSENASSLLVQTASNDKEKLDLQIEQIKKSIKDIPIEIPIEFTDKPSEYAKLWKVRKGLFPTVGAMRETGTSVIIEDVCFPVPELAEAIPALQALFSKYGYDEAVIFGHALEGNVHFVFSQDFDDKKELERYKAFMDDLAKLVVDRFDGALKAEHGTGRNMAPFVEKEWGSEAYEMMKRLKAIFDPNDLLNPGVILNNDPELHLKNLKPMPAAHETIDMCTECGFCEPACVSHDLTLSPRQRITVYREMMRLQETGEKPEVLASMEKAYDYQSLDTCATDGLCGMACPLDINTGEFVKDLRRKKNTPTQKKVASAMAPRMAMITSATKFALNTSNLFHSLLGSKTMDSVAGGLRKISGNRVPKWNKYLPKAAPKVKPEKYTVKDTKPDKVVYFPSCINQTMGLPKGQEENVPLTTKVKQLIHKSGYEIIYPKDLSGHCCGMPFSSKGFKEQGKEISDSLEQALYEASDGGRYPIVCDMSSCQLTMVENMEPRLKVYGPVEFTLKYLAPKLDFQPTDEPISVFAVCSAKKLGMESKLEELAKLCAKSVVVPETNCCGFAGDRGFSHPELVEHGLRHLNGQIPKEVKNGYCTNRTCEIGLSTHSDITYSSILYLVDQVTTAKKKPVKAQ
ncbi:FAD-binding and (Fe-S)-binding domain-containing protein [Rhodohalobacter sp.]|uniref:FAD-binding and (Fe-S)-binding domain-containing protein n=1 Tax=Rhodohalobacter sp. TaxID=1974210 RepID=UPI003561431C